VNDGAVLVTGAAGGIGQYVVEALIGDGRTVVAADLKPTGARGIAAEHVGDLLDPGFVGECLRPVAGRITGVVHLAAVPAPGIVGEHETLLHNLSIAYLMFDAAGRRGVPRVVAASSLAAVGLAWADRYLIPRYVPVDESHPSLLIDSYGLSKAMTEDVAAFTTRRFGTTTICLRFPFVGTGERLQRRLDDVRRDPAGGSRELWAWLDTRDAARAVLAALRAPLTGHHVLNIAAPDTTADEPTAHLLEAAYPDAEVRGDLGGHTGLIDTRRAARTLDFTTCHAWRVHNPDKVCCG
jgi:nucleoside-diphosphate-sugar epimerase